MPRRPHGHRPLTEPQKALIRVLAAQAAQEFVAEEDAKAAKAATPDAHTDEPDAA